MSRTSFKGKSFLTDAWRILLIAVITACKKGWWLYFFCMAVQGTNGNWLSSVITVWICQSCHFSFTFEHKSVSNYCTAKLKYPQGNSNNKTLVLCLWDKELCWRQNFGFGVPYFILKFKVMKASKCIIQPHFAQHLLLGSDSWSMLKLSDTILVHLNNKWLCSLSQLYKLSIH